MNSKNSLTATELMKEKNIGHLFQSAANLIRLSLTRMWLDYDREADVLYLHFDENPSSSHSEMTDKGIVLDYRDDTLVGLTILEAFHC